MTYFAATVRKCKGANVGRFLLAKAAGKRRDSFGKKFRLDAQLEGPACGKNPHVLPGIGHRTELPTGGFGQIKKVGEVFVRPPLKSLRNIVHDRKGGPANLGSEFEILAGARFFPNQSMKLPGLLPNLQLLEPSRQRHL